MEGKYFLYKSRFGKKYQVIGVIAKYYPDLEYIISENGNKYDMREIAVLEGDFETIYKSNYRTIKTAIEPDGTIPLSKFTPFELGYKEDEVEIMSDYWRPKIIIL